MDLARQDEARAIVRATVDLARSLSMRVTAEGVETVQQLQAVRTLGCTEIQGYLLSPPRPAAEALQLLPSPGEEVDYPLHESVGGQKYTKVCRARPDLECNHRLTERECDVLEGILAGHSSEESAGHLNVKPAFIEDYRERIKQK